MESYNLTEAYLEIYEAYNEKGEFIREPNSTYSGENIPRPPAVRSSPEAIRARNAHREVLRRQREQEKLKTPEQIEAERQERMIKARAILNPQSSNESYEFVISYLIVEGYASNFASAEAICGSMSEAWAYEILAESSLADMFAAENEKNAASIKRDKEALDRLAKLRASLSKHTEEPEPIKKPKSTGDAKSRIEIIKAKLRAAEEKMDRQDRERY